MAAVPRALTANLSGGCAKRRLRVLAVDLDPAGALTWHLAATVPPLGVADVLAGRLPLADAVTPTEVRGLDLLAGSEALTEWDHKPQVARAALSALIEQAGHLPHDLVIFDTAPDPVAPCSPACWTYCHPQAPPCCYPFAAGPWTWPVLFPGVRPGAGGGPSLLGIVPTMRRDALSRDVLASTPPGPRRPGAARSVRGPGEVARAPLKHLPVQYAAPHAAALENWERLDPCRTTPALTPGET